MNLFRYIREAVNYLLVFCSINDNFMVDHFGESILKIIVVLFVLVNIGTVIRTSASLVKKEPVFFFFIFFSVISYCINISSYDNLVLPLTRIISVVCVFCIISQNKNPEAIMLVYVLSAVFSSYLCFFSVDTVTEWTFRKTGGTYDPNEYSLTVLVPMLYLIYKLKSAEARKIIIIVPVLFLFAIGLLYACSKSAFLSLALSLCIAFILILRESSFRGKVIHMVVIFFAIISIYKILQFFYSDSAALVVSRFEDNNSMNERLISWKAGMEMFLDNPLFGVGPDNYSNMISIHYPDIEESSRAAHNIFIQTIVENGILCLVAFALFLYKPFKLYNKRKMPPEYLMGFIVLIFMCLSLAVLYKRYVWVYVALLYNNNITVFRNEKRVPYRINTMDV